MDQDMDLALQFVDQILAEAGYTFIPPDAPLSEWNKHKNKTFSKCKFVASGFYGLQSSGLGVRAGRTPSGARFSLIYENEKIIIVMAAGDKKFSLGFGDPMFSIKLVGVLHHDGNIT